MYSAQERTRASRMGELALRFPDDFVTALAKEVAAKLAPLLVEPQQRVPNGTLAARITLDEFVALLPPAKRPETWKRWLYDHLGEAPREVAGKLGGDWFLDRERGLAWVEGLTDGVRSRAPVKGRHR